MRQLKPPRPPRACPSLSKSHRSPLPHLRPQAQRLRQRPHKPSAQVLRLRPAPLLKHSLKHPLQRQKRTRSPRKRNTAKRKSTSPLNASRVFKRLFWRSIVHNASLFYCKQKPKTMPKKTVAPSQWLALNALKQPSLLLSLIQK